MKNSEKTTSETNERVKNDGKTMEHSNYCHVIVMEVLDRLETLITAFTFSIIYAHETTT